MNRTDVFALLLLFLVIAGTFFTYYMTREQYVHAPLIKECSEPYAYPICQRSVEPGVKPDPGLKQIYVGMIFMVILAFALIILSFRGSVTKQADLNVTGVQQQPSHHGKAGTPEAIPRNTIQQDEVIRNG